MADDRMAAMQKWRTDQLHDKYRVERRDGRDQPGDKHDDCEYFVLDLTHDANARAAALAYAKMCGETDLAASLAEQAYRLAGIARRG